MNLEPIRPTSKPLNRWQADVTVDVRMVGGQEWHEKLYNREE
jgi:hypothetical protein